MKHIVFLVVSLVVLSLSAFAIAANPIEWDRVVPLEDLKAVKFKNVKPDPAPKHEKRGFVTVPFDYARPDGPSLEIFYRLIPSLDFTDKPVIVVVNGGPGIASFGYQPYEFDYENPKQVESGRFYHLRKNFRVLIIDQRGTDGYSAALDLTDPKTDPVIINRYFDSDEHARDHERVIDAVLAKDEPFILLGQSYAGHVVSHYLTLDGIKRSPKAVIFSSAIVPHQDAHPLHVARRTEQLQLNLSLRKKHPDVVDKLKEMRGKLAACKLEENLVNNLWGDLGRGKDGEWEPKLYKQIADLVKEDCEDIELYLRAKSLAGVNLINYILSSACISTGETDRTSAAKLQKEIPFEPWMLDEAWTNAQIGVGSPKWFTDLLDRIDETPPPAPNFLPIAEIKNRFAAHKAPILHTFGTGDAFLPFEFQAPQVLRFVEFPQSQLRILPGGHSAIFQEAGGITVADWYKE